MPGSNTQAFWLRWTSSRFDNVIRLIAIDMGQFHLGSTSSFARAGWTGTGIAPGSRPHPPVRGGDRRAGLIAIVLGLTLAQAVAAVPGPSFDARRNPFTYGREYRDPSWGGIYLRARWYDPQLPSFLSRDPAQQIDHYGYAGGNPLMHVDPSGSSYRSAFGGPLEHGLAYLNSGVGGHFARVFLGQFLVPLQMLAAPAAFWHSTEHDSAGTAVFLSVGIAAEGAAYGAMFSRAVRIATTSSASKLFWARLTGEAALGSGQSVASSFSHRGAHFHSAALGRGLETTFGPEIVYRIALGIGYEPYNLKQSDVRRLLQRANLDENTALVFRVHSTDLIGYGGEVRTGKGWLTPWADQLKLGTHTERLIGVTNRGGYAAEVLPVRMGVLHLDETREFGELGKFADDDHYNHWFQYLGKVDVQQLREVFGRNPRNLYTAVDAANDPTGRLLTHRSAYDFVRNNCHHHVADLRAMLGL